MSKHLKRRKPLKLPLLILLDVAMIGAALVIFALFHHVIPYRQQSTGIVSERPGGAYTDQPETEEEMIFDLSGAELNEASEAAQIPAEREATIEPTIEPTPEPTPQPTEIVPDATPAPTATPDPVGYFGRKFSGKFCEAGGAQNGNNYQGVNANVTVIRKKIGRSYVCVEDIYIRDISNLITVFAKDQYGHGYTEWAGNMAARRSGIATITGDYYGTHSDGIVIRNGTVYRATNSGGADVCVLYWDGVMETYKAQEFNVQAAVKRGAYQAWCFGPELLDENGKAYRSFDSEIARSNPRAAIGYYEPGHYCFVLVEGRTVHSTGMTLTELSATMEALGCKSAYNLDGGATAMMFAGTQRVNEIGDNSRPCSDAIMIVN